MYNSIQGITQNMRRTVACAVELYTSLKKKSTPEVGLVAVNI